MRLRHALIHDVAISIRVIAKILFAWSYTLVNGTLKTIVKNENMLTLLFLVSCIHTFTQIRIGDEGMA